MPFVQLRQQPTPEAMLREPQSRADCHRAFCVASIAEPAQRSEGIVHSLAVRSSTLAGGGRTDRRRKRLEMWILASCLCCISCCALRSASHGVAIQAPKRFVLFPEPFRCPCLNACPWLPRSTGVYISTSCLVFHDESTDFA